MTTEHAHLAGERAGVQDLQVSGLTPTAALRAPLIRPFLAVVDRVTTRSCWSSPHDLPFATVSVTVRNASVSLADGLEATLDGTCRIVTLDLGEQPELIRPGDGQRVEVEREAAALIIAALFMRHAREADEIPEDERAALVGMYYVARYAVYAKHPDLARVFLE